jgi:hypothetical protein
VVRAVIWLPGLAVALGAAVATAHGLFEVAVAARVPTGIAWLYPLMTDGLALVAYTATARLDGSARRYAWTVVVLAAGLSGLAQAAYLAGDATLHASPALRFGVGAWPAVAAAVVAHLLYLLAADPPAPAAPTWAAGAISEVTPASAAPPPVRTDGDVFDRLAAATASTAGVVQGGVQPGLYTPAAVQPDPYKPLRNEPGDPLPGIAESALDAVADDPVEHLAEAVEQPVNAAADPAPRDRARAAAVQHAARHGALPTVTELEALAAVSRGTAAAALKVLRAHPAPLHLVHDTPDQRTQP